MLLPWICMQFTQWVVAYVATGMNLDGDVVCILKLVWKRKKTIGFMIWIDFRLRAKFTGLNEILWSELSSEIQMACELYQCDQTDPIFLSIFFSLRLLVFCKIFFFIILSSKRAIRFHSTPLKRKKIAHETFFYSLW